MVKVLTVVFGIGIAVVIYIVMLLAIQAFYAEPKYEDFCNDTEMYSDPIFEMNKCTDDMSVKECRQNIEVKATPECQKKFDSVSKIYNRNFFIIASILGTLILITSYFLLKIPNISAGVACSGIVLIFWAFARGWESTDAKLKFVIALVIAVIVVILTVLVNKKFSRK